MIQVDRHTVIQILGSLMAQPSLLNDTDKYLLEKDDFSQTMDKYIFSGTGIGSAQRQNLKAFPEIFGIFKMSL